MFSGEKIRSYVQGAIGALVVAVLIGLSMALWSHFWTDRWQSAELYRLRTQLADEQKVQAEVVKWINGVIQAQQQAGQAAQAPAAK